MKTDPKALTAEQIRELADEHASIGLSKGMWAFSECDLISFARALATREQTASTGEPYGRVTTHKLTGQQFFYRWPEPPYLDNASECITLYAAPVEQAGSTSDETLREALAEEQARELFNEWYEKQPMPQLLARLDPQQAAHNAFEFGRALATPTKGEKS